MRLTTLDGTVIRVRNGRDDGRLVQPGDRVISMEINLGQISVTVRMSESDADALAKKLACRSLVEWHRMKDGAPLTGDMVLIVTYRNPTEVEDVACFRAPDVWECTDAKYRDSDIKWWARWPPSPESKRKP